MKSASSIRWRRSARLPRNTASSSLPTACKRLARFPWTCRKTISTCWRSRGTKLTGPRALALFTFAVQNRGKLHAGIAAANVKSANALGPVNFVPRDRQQVDIVFLHVHGNLANRLHAVGSEDDAVFLGNLADLRHRINDADFIVGIHDGDQDGGG